MTTSMEMMRNIKKCREKHLDDFESESRNIIEIISDCLQINKEDRPSLIEIQASVEDHMRKYFNQTNYKAN